MKSKNFYKVIIGLVCLFFVVILLFIFYSIYAKFNIQNDNNEQANIESNEIKTDNNLELELSETSEETSDKNDDETAEKTSDEIEETVEEDPQEEPIPIDQVYSYKGLVELKKVDPTFVTDIKNATTDNITGVVQYEYDLALVNIDMVEPLMKAQQLAMADGYRIKIWDAYRPISVQKAMNDILPADKKKFVPAPSNTSQHCRGIAVDVTLVDENGEELDMPTGYCEFSEATYPNYNGATETQTKNREYLKRIMSEVGLKVLSNEWWHYYLPTYQKYERLDIRFDQYVEYRENNLQM